MHTNCRVAEVIPPQNDWESQRADKKYYQFRNPARKQSRQIEKTLARALTLKKKIVLSMERRNKIKRFLFVISQGDDLEVFI